MLIQRQETQLTGTFGDRLQKVGHMIIMLDTYQNPVYTKRVWCIYETYVATSTGIKTDVAIPRSDKIVFGQSLKRGNFAEVAESLTDIDTEKAEASHKSDEDEIKGLIHRSIGFVAVNETVKSALISWLAQAFGDYLKSQAVSDVARCVFALIMGNSGADACPLTKWLKFCKKHPDMLEYLAIENLSFNDSFYMLCGTEEGCTITLRDVEAYLHKQGKSNVNDFAKWVRGIEDDQAITEIREGLSKDLFDKVNELDMQINRVHDALKELTQGGEALTIKAPDGQHKSVTIRNSPRPPLTRQLTKPVEDTPQWC